MSSSLALRAKILPPFPSVLGSVFLNAVASKDAHLYKVRIIISLAGKLRLSCAVERPLATESISQD